MKIRGKLAELLVEIDPQTYAPYIIQEQGRKIIYVRVLKAIYGMLQSALLFYNKLSVECWCNHPCDCTEIRATPFGCGSYELNGSD